MKYPVILLAAFSALSTGQADESKQDFRSAVIQVINEEDWDGYKALTFKEGMTDYDQKMMETMKPVILDGEKIISGKFLDLPADYRAIFVYDGRVFEPTIMPQGLLKLENIEGSTTVPYARHDDKFVLAGTKSKDIGWEGPEDVPLSIVILGYNNEDLDIEASWNASGRSFSEKLGYTSTNFFGQYVEKVTVQSDDPDAVYQLRIIEGGKEVFKSEKHKGIGEIRYKRDVNESEQATR